MSLELNFTFENDKAKKDNNQKAVFGNRHNRIEYRRNQKRNQERKDKSTAKTKDSAEPTSAGTAPAKPIGSDDEPSAKISKVDDGTKNGKVYVKKVGKEGEVFKKPTPKNFSEKDSVKNVGSSKSSDRLFKDLEECEVIVAPTEVTMISEKVFDDENSFANLSPPLHEYLVKNLKDEGKTKMTLVQKEALPHALVGKDLKVKAQTGSGKTLVYALPILHILGSRTDETRVKRSDGPYAIVICPTRELSIQSYETVEPLLRTTFNWIIPGIVNGGTNRKTEKRMLRKGVNILMGTPGRLYDHIRQTDCLDLSNVEFLVVDEADRLFEQTFELQVREIITSIQQKREGKKLQTILLSATLSAGVETLAGMTLVNPITVDLGAESVKLNADDYKSLENEQFSVPENLQQMVCFVPLKLKFLTLFALLKKRLQAQDKTVVFFSCIEEIKFFYKVLVDANLELTDNEDDLDQILALHGDMPQERRKAVYTKFKEAKNCILLSTDVTERGLHFNDVSWIIQYDPAPTIRGYVHRVGRTARVGEAGKSITLLCPEQKVYLDILAESGIKVKCRQVADIINRTFAAKNSQMSRELASKVQKDYESYVNDNRSVKTLAIDTYAQFLRSYMTYRQELGFVAKDLHFGHLAKSFGLIDPPTQLVAERRDLKHWVKNGIHHGERLHRDAKDQKQLETLNVVKWDERLKKRQPEKTDSEEPVPEKIKERIDLETEMSYLPNKEKDHKYTAHQRDLHFDEIDDMKVQRMEKQKKERKEYRQGEKERIEYEKANPELDENGVPVFKALKPEGKIIKIHDEKTKRAKMVKQMNRARIVERSGASEFASSTGKGTKSVMAKRR